MEDKKQVNLGTGSIPKLMLKLAIPAVIAQLINVLYSMVDRIYIANIPDIGSVALTGVGVCFPILMIVSAFSAFVGFGGAPQAAIKMGEGDYDGAEKILGSGVVMLLGISVMLSIIILMFQRPLLMAFGASENTVQYGMDYLQIYMYGTIFVQFALGLNTFISCQGQAKTAMYSVLIGAIANIILDPILIFGFNMGVKGAAWATIISQSLSAIWVVRFLLSDKSKLKIRKKYIVADKKVMLSIAALGISPFVMQSTESLVTIVLNSSLQKYGGDIYVGAMTIVLSIYQVFIMPISGFAQGVTPILSYNFGAKNMDRVKQAFKYLLGITFSLSVVAWAAMMFMPEMITRAFTPDENLIQVTVTALRRNMAGTFIFGVMMACQNTFLALGQAKISLILALLRKIILLIPLALVLPVFMGVMGVFTAQPIADVVAALTALTIFVCRINTILDKKKNQ